MRGPRPCKGPNSLRNLVLDLDDESPRSLLL